MEVLLASMGTLSQKPVKWTGTLATNGTGQASFSYAGLPSLPGVDQVQSTAMVNSRCFIRFTSLSVLRAAMDKVNPKDGLTYVWIPPGSFEMGCLGGECIIDELPKHSVTLTHETSPSHAHILPPYESGFGFRP